MFLESCNLVKWRFIHSGNLDIIYFAIEIIIRGVAKVCKATLRPQI